MARFRWRMLIDWGIDLSTLEDQINGCDTLGPFASYRKISALLVWGAGIATVAVGLTSDLMNEVVALAVIVYSVLGVFIYRGHRWAFLLMMLLWTLDKGSAAYVRLMLGNVPGVLFTVLWWSFYMSVFWRAFTVEQERRVPPVRAVGGTPTPGDSSR